MVDNVDGSDYVKSHSRIYRKDAGGVPASVLADIERLYAEMAGEFYEHTRCNKIRSVEAVAVADDGSLGEALLLMGDGRTVGVDCCDVDVLRVTLGDALRWDVTSSHVASMTSW